MREKCTATGALVASSIKSQYVGAIQELSHRYGSSSVNYRIPQSVTLEQCIGYAQKHIVQVTEENQYYRYGRYSSALTDMLRQVPDFGSARRIVHIDIGCGPGLFSWVVHDHFLNHNPGQVSLHGYDRAPEMVKLGELLWGEMVTRVPIVLESDLRKFLVHIADISGRQHSDVIVSFGHVLVQTVDDMERDPNASEAFVDFSKIVAACSNRNSRCVVVAVDAHSSTDSADRQEQFDRACKRLKKELQNSYGLRLKMQRLPKYSQRYGVVEVLTP